MNARVKKVAARILKLRDEFEDQDILEATRYVSSILLQDSSSDQQSRKPRPKSKRSVVGSPRSAVPKASRVVLALKKTDPERYDVLTVLDSLLRAGKIIPSVDGIRTVGASLDKSFVAGKSRKEAIPKLMKLLAALPLDQLREIVESLLQQPHDERDRSDEHAYNKLAAFLIRGK